MRKMRLFGAISLVIASALILFTVACDKNKDGSSENSWDITGPSVSVGESVAAPTPAQAVAAPTPAASLEQSPCGIINTVSDSVPDGAVSGPVSGIANFDMKDAGELGLTVLAKSFHCSENTGEKCDSNSPDWLGITDPLISKEKWAAHESGPLTITVGSENTPEQCGRYQIDAGTVEKNLCQYPSGVFWAKVVTYAARCNMCGTLDPKIWIVSQSDHTVTLGASFRLGGGAVVYFGDGSSKGITSGGTLTHAYATHGEFTAKLLITRDGVPCPATVAVTVKPTCEDINPQLTATKTGETDTTIAYNVTANVAGTFVPAQPVTYTKGDADRTETINFTSTEAGCAKSITVNVPKKTKKMCSDYAVPTITLTPHTSLTSTLQTVTSITASPSGGTFSPTLPQVYNRPAYGQSAQTKTFTYTLPYSPAEGVECSTSKTVDVTVPPKERSCSDMNVDVTANVDGDDVVCNASWTGPGSGLIRLDSGSWSSVGNPGSKAYNSLSVGNHTCNLSVTAPSVVSGGLSCSDSASFTISCETASWWDQSIAWNSNDIKANVHVRGDGNYILRLYATSSYSEYTNNNPDYIKDTDSDNIECRGQGELKVDYRWAGHPSRYWWADLTRDGVRVWKSQAVDKNDPGESLLPLSFVSETPVSD